MPEPRRILFVNSVPQIGGAEHSMIELASHLNQDRFRPVALVGAQGPLLDALKTHDIPTAVTDFPFFSRRRPWIYGRAMWHIREVIRRYDVALIHVNCDRAVPHCVRASRLTGVPILCHIHDMTRAWFLPSYVKRLNTSHRIIADSQATAQHCLKAGMREDLLQVIYECFEMDKFSRVDDDTRDRMRKNWEVNEDEILVGLVGHVLRYKGHEEFVRAAAIVAEQLDNVRFMVVGDDRLSSEPGFLPFLYDLVDSFGLKERFTFLGYSDNIPDVMAALDIVAVPSWSEPFGRVVIEAQACGRPVIGTRAGGIPEIITDGVDGLLITPKKPEELATRIIELALDENLRKMLGTRGRQSATRFDITSHVSQFQNTYDAILSGRTDTLPKVPFGEPNWSELSTQAADPA